MLKISLLRNVRKIDPKIDFKINRILTLSWRISLKIRFSYISYILN